MRPLLLYIGIWQRLRAGDLLTLALALLMALPPTLLPNHANAQDRQAPATVGTDRGAVAETSPRPKSRKRSLYKRIKARAGMMRTSRLHVERSFRYGEPVPFESLSSGQQRLLNQINTELEALLKDLRSKAKQLKQLLGEEKAKSEQITQEHFDKNIMPRSLFERMERIRTLWKEYRDLTLKEEGKRVLLPRGPMKLLFTGSLTGIVDLANHHNPDNPRTESPQIERHRTGPPPIESHRSVDSTEWQNLENNSRRAAAIFGYVSFEVHGLIYRLLASGLLNRSPNAYFGSQGQLRLEMLRNDLVEIESRGRPPASVPQQAREAWAEAKAWARVLSDASSMERIERLARVQDVMGPEQRVSDTAGSVPSNLKKVDPRAAATWQANSARNLYDVRMVPAWARPLLFIVHHPEQPLAVEMLLRQGGFKSLDVFCLRTGRILAPSRNVATATNFIGAKILSDAVLLAMFKLSGVSTEGPRSFMETFVHSERLLELGAALAGFFYIHRVADWTLVKSADGLIGAGTAKMVKDNFGILSKQWLHPLARAEAAQARATALRDAAKGSSARAAADRAVQEAARRTAAARAAAQTGAGMSGKQRFGAITGTAIRSGIPLFITLTALHVATLHFNHPLWEEVDYLRETGRETEASMLAWEVRREIYFSMPMLMNLGFTALSFMSIPMLLNISAMKAMGAAGLGLAFEGSVVAAGLLSFTVLAVTLALLGYAHYRVGTPLLVNDAYRDGCIDAMNDYRELVHNLPGSDYFMGRLDAALEFLGIQKQFDRGDPQETEELKLNLLQAMLDGTLTDYINTLFFDYFYFHIREMAADTELEVDLERALEILEEQGEAGVMEALGSAIPSFLLSKEFKEMRGLYDYYLVYNTLEKVKQHRAAGDLKDGIEQESPQLLSEAYAPLADFLDEITQYAATAMMVTQNFENYRNHLGFTEINTVETAWAKKQTELEAEGNTTWQAVIAAIEHPTKLTRLINDTYANPKWANGYGSSYPEAHRLIQGRSPKSPDPAVVEFWAADEVAPIEPSFTLGPENPRESEVFMQLIEPSALYQMLKSGERDRQTLESAAEDLGIKIILATKGWFITLKRMETVYHQNEYILALQQAAMNLGSENDASEVVDRAEIVRYDVQRDQGTPINREYQLEVEERADAIGINPGQIITDAFVPNFIGNTDPNTTWSTLYTAELAFWASRWWHSEDSESAAESDVVADWIAMDQRYRMQNAFKQSLYRSFQIDWIRDNEPEGFSNLWQYQESQARWFHSAIVDPVVGVDPNLTLMHLEKTVREMNRLLPEEERIAIEGEQ